MVEGPLIANTLFNATGWGVGMGNGHGLLDGEFRVTGFSEYGFAAEAPLGLVGGLYPEALANVKLVRGGVAHEHLFWLRYTRRGFGAAHKKRVQVDLLVRFVTFRYQPADDVPEDQRRRLVDAEIWGIADLTLKRKSSGRGRNPFNKFNESGHLTFSAQVVKHDGGRPYIQIDYTAYHGGKVVKGAPILKTHNDTGSFVVGVDGSFEIDSAAANLPTMKHFRISRISGEVHTPTFATVVADGVEGPPDRERGERYFNATGIELKDGHPWFTPDTELLDDNGRKIKTFAVCSMPDVLRVKSGGRAYEAKKHRSRDPRSFLLEYRRNGSVLGVRKLGKVAALLRLTVTPFTYAVAGPEVDLVVCREGVPQLGFADVSISLLKAGADESGLKHDAAYDIRTVKSHGEEFSLEFDATVYIDSNEEPLLRITWTAKHGGKRFRSRSHEDTGHLDVRTDRHGNPEIKIGADSAKYFTVTG